MGSCWQVSGNLSFRTLNVEVYLRKEMKTQFIQDMFPYIKC